MDMGIMNYVLNREYLLYRIGELQLKQSYIAYKMGVSEKTVSRWTTGKVTQIKEANLIALSEILECSPGNLKTTDEQTDYVRTLLDKDLLSKLSPHGDFELAEQILKHALPKYLDDELRAEVYLEIASTNWRTQRYDQARQYCLEALAIGNMAKNKSIIFQAAFQIGTIDSIVGSKAALSYLMQAYELREHAKSSSKVAALCNNLGMHLNEIGYSQDAYPYILEAFSRYTEEDKYYNMCIAIQSLLTLKLVLEDYQDFDSLVADGLSYAEKASFHTGKISIKLYDLKYHLDTKQDLLDTHHESIRHYLNNFNPYVSDIYYAYHLMIFPEEAERVFEILTQHKEMVPFMKAMLYMMKYQHYRQENDYRTCEEILRSIGCENWLVSHPIKHDEIFNNI